MELRAREAEPDDFRHLLRLTYPAAKPGTVLRREVEAEWDWLWRSGRYLATVVEDRERGDAVGFWGAVLIAPGFYRRLVKAHHPYCNRRLARAPKLGDQPWATPEGLMDGTATMLINHCAWDTRLGEPETAVVRGATSNAFLDQHGGYALARMAVEVVGSEFRDLTLRTGASVVNDYAAWSDARFLHEAERPYLLAIERDEALRTENHWHTRAFRNQAAKLDLSAIQRETLRYARSGLTDAQIAERLCLSVETVRKRWEGVYARFYDRLPGVLAVTADGKRGAEKRRLVLSFLQDRLEELRP